MNHSKLSKKKPVQVIAIASGKGGVGKSNTAINLSIALSRKGKKVLLLDADLGLANINVMLGLRPEFNLSHVLNGEKSLTQILLSGPENIKIIPSSSGIQYMSELGERDIGLLIQVFSELEEDYDYLIIDTAAGISGSVLYFLKAAHQVVIIATDEPSSITDAYALIKVLKKEHGISNLFFIANMVDSANQGRILYEKINKTVDRFLGGGLIFLGSIPFDRQITISNRYQTPIITSDPRASASLSYMRVARNISNWSTPVIPRGDIEFFFERFFEQLSHN